MLEILLNSLPNFILLFVYGMILVFLDAYLIKIILIVLPMFLLMSYFTSKQMFRLVLKSQKNRDDLIEFLNIHVSNKLLIFLYNLQNEEKLNFKNVSKKLMDNNIRVEFIVSTLNNITSFISIVTPISILFIGSIRVINGYMSLGSLIAFNTYATLLFVPLSKLLMLPSMYSKMKASLVGN